MIPYRDPSQPQMSVAMSPRPGSLGGPPQMPAAQQQQPQPGPPPPPQQPGPHGIMMGRGASNTGLQNPGIPMANSNPNIQNVAAAPQLQQAPHLPDNDEEIRSERLLNTYIYEHLLRSGFYQAARGLLSETSIQVVNPGQRDDSSPNQDNDTVIRRGANLKRSHSGIDPHSSPNDKANGKSPISGTNSPRNEPHDLPPVDLPLKGPGHKGFLRGWWVVFWDIYAARLNISSSQWAHAYLEAQRNQGRMPQIQGQYNPPIQQRSQMINGVGEDMDKKPLIQTAIANNGRKISRPGQQQMPIQNQAPNQAPQVQAMALKQQQVQQQRENETDPNSSSPAMGQANSPNKRPRLSPPGEFPVPSQIPTQPGQPPNGMQPGQHPPGPVPMNTERALQFLKAHNINPAPGTSAQDILTMAQKFALSMQNPQAHKNTLSAYRHSLSVQQSQQGLAARPPMGGMGGATPPNPQGQIPFGNPGISGPINFQANTHPTREQLKQLSDAAKQLGGDLQHPPSGSHSLHDYQGQLMLLEQQNKRRLQHARQETGVRPDEPGAAGMNGQFPPQQGASQPGHPQIQGTNMSPSTSHAGRSPQISNLDLTQQRKPSQKTGSTGSSPEPGGPVGQMPGPGPAFAGQPGITAEQFPQMAQMGQGYPQAMFSGQQNQFMPGRPHPGMSFNQAQNSMAVSEMLKARMAQQAGQPGQAFQPGWPQHMVNQPINQQMRQPSMVPGQQGPQPQPATTAQQQMPPPPQPQQSQAARPQGANESPSLANAQPPTPNPGNKPAPKGKPAKEPSRAKRNRGKNAPAPATPNASEPPTTPTTPATAHPQLPFNAGQPSPASSQIGQSQPASQPATADQQPQPSQEPAPPSAFTSIAQEAEMNGDVWTSDEKWMSQMPDFGFTSGIGDFGTSNFTPIVDEDIINYGDFLNDNDGLTGIDLSMWEDIGGTEA